MSSEVTPTIPGVGVQPNLQSMSTTFCVHVTNQKEVLSLDNDFRNFVALNLRSMPIEIVSQKRLDKLKAPTRTQRWIE
jgi:hypothetical protein